MIHLLLGLSLAAPMAAADSVAGFDPAPPPPAAAEARAAGGARGVRVVPLTAPVTVDGVLSEEVWRCDHAFFDFVQKEPVEGATPSQPTEVRVAHDEDALYVGARLGDSAPDSIVAQLARRDDGVEADRFGVYLDPYRDRRSGYYFMVNAAGTLYDGTLFNDDQDDDSWDAVWDGRARRDAHGWTVEMRIPFSQLRFHRGALSTWGINFVREIARWKEEDYAVYTPRKESGFVSRFPELAGFAPIRPAHSPELIPFATAQAEYRDPDPGDPFNDGSRLLSKGGLDLRAGVGRGLTLNATVTPDFGQVEVDPDKVNLTEFETFFEEKRPFFTEGAGTFAFGREGAADYWDYDWDDPLFFYSRRIGRAPQGRTPRADFASVPEQTTILGAGKLIGRLGPDWTLGTLHAITGREAARLWNDGVRTEAEVEPQSYYGVARTQTEFWNRRAGLGVLGTSAVRSFSSDRLRDEVSRGAALGGIDGWWFLDSRRAWVVSGWTAASRVEGTAKRMISLQRSSARYFQRPDAGHVEVDSAATSLDGYGSRLWLIKQKGAFRFNSALGVVSPGFEVNDLGFQRRADWVNGHVGGGYRWSNPTPSVKYQSLKAAVFATCDYGGVPIGRGVATSGYTELRGGSSLSYWAGFDGPAFDPRRTRGGPLTASPARGDFGIEVNAYSRTRTYYFAELTGSASRAGSWDAATYLGAEWKPAPSFSLKLVPGFQRTHEDAQFVTSISDPVAAATYGRRYVFGTLDQTTFSTSLRLNWILRPTLSLQSYIAPYLAAARYSGFKSLVRSRSYDFEPYGYGGDPDFVQGSLKGNSVLRWEYRPGSVLFLVWTQKRSDYEAGPGDFLPGRTFSHLVGSRPDNVFLVKLSYHLGG